MYSAITLSSVRRRAVAGDDENYVYSIASAFVRSCIAAGFDAMRRLKLSSCSGWFLCVTKPNRGNGDLSLKASG